MHSASRQGDATTPWGVGTECQCHLMYNCTLPGCLGKTKFLCCPWSNCPWNSQQLWAQCSCLKGALTLPAGCWLLLSQWVLATSTIRQEILLTAPPHALQASPRGLSVTPDSTLCGLFFLLSLTAKHSQHPSALGSPKGRVLQWDELLSKEPAHQAKLAHTSSHPGTVCSLEGFAQAWIAKTSCPRNTLGSGDFSVSGKEPHRVSKISHTPSSLALFLGNCNKLPEQRGNPRMCGV